MQISAFALGFALLAVSPVGFAAIGSDDAAEMARYERVAAAQAARDAGAESATMPEEAARLRQAGEQACQQAVDVAAQFGETFRAIGLQMPRLLSLLGEEVSRDAAPTMRRFAERLREMAEQIDRRPPGRPDSAEPQR